MVGGVGISTDPELDRTSVFDQSDRTGDISTYQPEDDGWKVVRIDVGKQLHVCLIVRVVLVVYAQFSGSVTLLEPVTSTDGIVTEFKLPYHYGDRQGMFEFNYHIHFFIILFFW